MLKVYTANYKYQGKERLDITVKSGDLTFSPTWEMVWALKKGKITASQYKTNYKELMRKSYKKNKKRWDEVLSKDEVVLVCFCASGEFCHRHLLADIFKKLGAEYIGEL